ncbi:nucleolin 1 [Brassica rapa]|uniref:nucleolin 1 n=1 Tax=Brassica campestris TaxID=3711 RepID=UPI00142D3317|nr:nucleolin 1 [Brassica rapa]
MDTYSRKRSAPKEPFDSEPAAKEKFNYISSRVRISVEGFSHGRPTDEIKSELINHFKSCGDLISVEVPTDPILESRAFVNYHGHLAKERALQLNGCDIGNWKALVKFAPREEDLDYQVSLRYHRSLYSDLANDKRFWYGIAVLGYDTSLPEDQVKSILTEHFSSCGLITHVFVCTPDECTNI